MGGCIGVGWAWYWVGDGVARLDEGHSVGRMWHSVGNGMEHNRKDNGVAGWGKGQGVRESDLY